MPDRFQIRRQKRAEMQIDDVIQDRGQAARLEVLDGMLVAIDTNADRPQAVRALVAQARDLVRSCQVAERGDYRRHCERGEMDALEEREEARNGQA